MGAETSFIDTNILLSATDSDRTAHLDALKLLKRALSGEVRLFACGQILREYLVVATRPVENNGLGLSPRKAVENLETFQQCLQLLDENHATIERLETLITTYKLKGKRIHDANIASIMIENGLKNIFTLNPNDFRTFKEVHTTQP